MGDYPIDTPRILPFDDRRAHDRQTSGEWRDRFDRRLGKLERDFHEFSMVQQDIHRDVQRSMTKKDSQFDAVCRMHQQHTYDCNKNRWLWGLAWGLAMFGLAGLYVVKW